MAAIASSFEVAPFSSSTGALENTELSFTDLYLHHIYSGPKPYQSTIIPKDATTGLGSTAVNNWPIYDGVGPDAKLVARAQGLHIFAGNWHNSFTIVFEVERFKGCTLEVMGVNVSEDGQWAIVGGTGEFTMACGVIDRKVYKRRMNGKHGNVIGLTIHGFCRSPLGLMEKNPPSAAENSPPTSTEQSPPTPTGESLPSSTKESSPLPTVEIPPTPM